MPSSRNRVTADTADDDTLHRNKMMLKRAAVAKVLKVIVTNSFRFVFESISLHEFNALHEFISILAMNSFRL